MQVCYSVCTCNKNKKDSMALLGLHNDGECIQGSNIILQTVTYWPLTSHQYHPAPVANDTTCVTIPLSL